MRCVLLITIAYMIQATQKGYKMGMNRVYDTVEFKNWAYKERLHSTEMYLFNRYLNKGGKTLEAGTGGGRILLSLGEFGFTSLCGFDFSSRLIEMARRRDVAHAINFEVKNAVELDYDEASFDQIIYLEQLISVIEGDDERKRALRESCRILKPSGVALFSFVCIEARQQDWRYRPLLKYLALFRRLKRSQRTMQSLPWLKLGGAYNLRALLDHGPQAYWFSLNETDQLLRESGFNIVAAGSNQQINEGRMCDSLEALATEEVKGLLFVVCTK